MKILVVFTNISKFKLYDQNEYSWQFDFRQFLKLFLSEKKKVSASGFFRWHISARPAIHRVYVWVRVHFLRDTFRRSARFGSSRPGQKWRVSLVQQRYRSWINPQKSFLLLAQSWFSKRTARRTRFGRIQHKTLHWLVRGDIWVL